jgi:hypothetical protein
VKRWQKNQTPPDAATALSRIARSVRKNRGLSRLAWQSLLWLSIMTLVTSCIVADPPQYTDPARTRPELSAYGAIPSVYQAVIIQTPSASTPSFSVPVRSEDVGEELNANFIEDYGASQKIIYNLVIAPSTYDDTSDRKITFFWTSVSSEDTGCHTISILVAHRTSFPTSSFVLDPMKGDSDAAIITWWVNVNPVGGITTTLVGCPSQPQAK